MANKAALDPYGLYLARLERKAKQKGWNIANFFRQRQEFFFFAAAAREGNAINIFQKWGQPAHRRALAASLCSRPTASAAWAPGWLPWQAAADGLRVLAQKSEL